MRCLAPFASPERARVAKSTTHVQYEPSNNDLNGRTIASSQRDKDRDHHCTMEVASHKPSAHHCRRLVRTSRKTSPTRLCSPITSARTFSIKGKFSDVVSTPQPSHTRQSPLLPHMPRGDIHPSFRHTGRDGVGARQHAFDDAHDRGECDRERIATHIEGRIAIQQRLSRL